ncbi:MULTISPECIES: amino acid ABC transporter permease [Vibrio]|uniref:Putative glutamine transport system permease protein GlnP n=1 Tax=Vibrio aestuarianus TaxID=28171 RepID=A0A9X4F718_9VIBR|nr:MULTISPECIES: amino acid ABC transporter permease [Vibrio]MDE1224315.1 amino acid ABC transporter permease [Vibrio aestuarianus]MDE1229653.1 amino acid ABC transporter permease [Vibrio aestuarianus]MDE1234824.1 amino acid ABC transporter permease [Vibrio aestuarianus]MDE1238703.1 amino acid ABC transporter permease [Vibrio aestuarianus]MDE1245661.1 amino acid ABC transporter permease [Vibrio aestuarianus]
MIKVMIKPVLSAAAQMVLLLLGMMWLLNSGAQAMGYQWQWERVPDYIAFYEDGEWWPAELIEGLVVTLQISAISLFLTLVIGLTTALLKLSNSIVGRLLANGYIELIRNTPLLVQIYLLYFVFGPVIGLDRFSTAVVALSLFQGAYTAEVFRGGLNSIAKGQFEASQSLGLSRFYTYYDVILPQLLQRTLPPLTNEVVSLIKNSSIVSVMAIFDLTTQGRNIVSETAMPFEIWFTVAGIYLLLTLSLSGLSAWLEHKLGAQWRSQK